MAASAVYHQYQCCSKWHTDILLAFDMAGIGIMIFGITLICVYLAFSSYPTSQILCVVMLIVMSLINMAL